MNERELASLINLTSAKLQVITNKYLDLGKPSYSESGYSKTAIVRCCQELRSTAQELMRLMK